MDSVSKIARLLRTPSEVILSLEEKMERISGKKGVIDEIAKEIDEGTTDKLARLGLSRKDPLTAEQVHSALMQKIKKDNTALFDHFHKPDLSTQIGCRSLINAVKESAGPLQGFYLKEEKARELFRLNPPLGIMTSLGYGDDVEKMLKNEDIFELFCALRFAETSDWLNDVFFKAYDELTKNDFEEREIKVMVLPERWALIGQKFLGRKLHQMSHLKEMGIVFVIPDLQLKSQKIIYLFFMTLHYIYETDWHARLFKEYSRKKDFAKRMISALKVEATKCALPDHDKMCWRVVPSYLAKKNPSDFRLAEPHVNSESIHFRKATKAIERFSKRFPELGLDFWRNSEILAEYFPLIDSEEEASISFDLFDNGISLLKEAGWESKYLYHQHEALWNKVFSSYVGEEEMEKLVMENLEKGYISLMVK